MEINDPIQSAALALIMDCRPMKEEGLSVVHNIKIKLLADALREHKPVIGEDTMTTIDKILGKSYRKFDAAINAAKYKTAKPIMVEGESLGETQREASGLVSQPQSPSLQPVEVTDCPAVGQWHHGAGYLCCGTFRIARADFDTNPSDEFKDAVFQSICDRMNNAMILRHLNERLSERESSWQSIETAPKDREILGFGSYLYPGDKDRTTYRMLIEWDRDSWCSYEGNHADGFFTHWQELTEPTDIEDEACK